MELIQRALTEITKYANNSRAHNEDHVQQIANSIKAFGFNNPILIDENGEIIAGHGRYEAGLLLGLSEVPCVVIKGLSSDQKRAYVIADNQIALNSTWDIDILRREIEDLAEADYAFIDALGFDDDYINALLDIEAELPELPDGDRDPYQQKTFVLHDDQAELIEEAISKAKTYGAIDNSKNDNANGNAITWICEQLLKKEG